MRDVRLILKSTFLAVLALFATLLSLATPALAGAPPTEGPPSGLTTGGTDHIEFPPTFDGRAIDDTLGRSLAESSDNFIDVASCDGVGNDCVHVIERYGADRYVTRLIIAKPCRWTSSAACVGGYTVAQRTVTHIGRYYSGVTYDEVTVANVSIAVARKPWLRPRMLDIGSTVQAIRSSSAGTTMLHGVLDVEGNVVFEDQVSFVASASSTTCHLLAGAASGIKSFATYPTVEKSTTIVAKLTGVAVATAVPPLGGLIIVGASHLPTGTGHYVLLTPPIGFAVDAAIYSGHFCDGLEGDPEDVPVLQGLPDIPFKQDETGGPANPFNDGANVNVTNAVDSIEFKILFSVELDIPEQEMEMVFDEDGNLVSVTHEVTQSDGSTTSGTVGQ